jgi:hypothetical protein
MASRTFWLDAHSAAGADYVPAFKFTAAFENTLLIAVASGVRAAIEANAIRTNSSAYSVRSCPSSSFQSFARIVLMFIPCGDGNFMIQTGNSRRKFAFFPTALNPPRLATQNKGDDD